MVDHARCPFGRIVLAFACGATVAACGSNGNSAGTSPTPTIRADVKFAQCIRSHGVPNFPDPGGSLPPGIKQSPAFRSAMQTCLRLEPQATSTGNQFTESQRIAALAQVQCIRQHGMPSFPDPTFPSTGGELFPTVPGFNAQSPAFRQAAAACGLTRLVGQPHGG